ncbi:DUF7545 family protein [Natrarchaeobaculum aegyptiacum]|uniref:Uncharacterized protein n=1 Tax=Natrarchaeobaculum aegyptiacum TaxID=745377 RepID=A0A2Z2HRH7_9EURY|nr:hypothetical protein [Natrarchaeobaculum aegyptiacum]ARS88655.1 hypothetical protein B1756_02035 [Natrarchaeobaculum aegyptiacum]
MSDDVATVTLTIDADDDTTDEVEVPAGLLELVAEGDQETAEIVGDVVALSFASRAHHVVHHGHGHGDDGDLEAQEQTMMDLFEERFGVTFGEATGHQH